jgi:hypothetical protein
MSPLANGVLATCFSGITICTDNPAANQARKSGFDIVIRNAGFSTGSVAFTLGPCPPYSEASSAVDLETVLLHELGHAINLGHIINPLQGSGVGLMNPANVMHYSISYNLRRISLDYSSMSGGSYLVTPHSFTYGTCVVGSPEMVPVATILESKDECPSTFPINTTPMFTTVTFDLAHATSNKLVDPAFTQMKLDGTGTSITNTAYYAFKTNDTGGDLSLEVLNYSTSPVQIAACTPGSFGVPVTGVKVSLYKVPSCPAGGAYPTPVAYNTFQANGVIPAVSGLSANSSYLLVMDGVQNTKAIFDIIFSGSALPMLSTELSGVIDGDHNVLTWTTDPSFGVSTMILERSDNGVDFVPLTEIIGKPQQESGQYIDMSPFPGPNYYRLKVTNVNASIQYSKVVMLNRGEGFTLNVYPNPAGPVLNIEILNNLPGEYGVTIHNSFGQLVVSRKFNVVSRKHIETINIANLLRGVYYVAAYGKDGKRIKAATIKLK